MRLLTGFLLTFTAILAADLPAIITAAKNTDRTALQALLKQGANVNATQGDGTAALHWASYRDDLESVGLLLRAGANVNVANDLGVTPLWNACLNGSAAMTARLLEAGADPNKALLSGETPLMTAARTGNAGVVEKLLGKAAEVNAHATRGQTALMWAVTQHHPDVVQVLLKHGAKVDARTETYRQLWQTDPVQDVHPDYQAWLDLGGTTPLLFAARTGDLASAKLLVAAGANVNDAAPYGASALVLASHSGNAELVEYLLNKDANPNTAGAGYTALHAAILRRNTNAVRALLEHGADPNAKLRASTPVRRSSEDIFFYPSFVGATPFWLAARFSEPEVMRLLVQHGADPKFTHSVEHWGERSEKGTFDREKWGPATALMAAVGMVPGLGFPKLDPAQREPMMLEAVKVAVESGVDVNAADADGRTALETATGRGYKTIAEFLTAHGAQMSKTARPLPKEPAVN